MGLLSKIAVTVAAMAITVQPAQACWNAQAQNAVKIKHLTTMLMVTALRCRKSHSNFLPNYNKFVQKHNSLIGSQNALIRMQLRKTMGKRAVRSANDRISIGFANRYGGGHPTMDCAALSKFARDMGSQQRSLASLVRIADSKLGQTKVPGRRCSAKIAARRK